MYVYFILYIPDTVMVLPAVPLDEEIDVIVATLHVVNKKLFDNGFKIEQLPRLIILPRQMLAGGVPL